jgi:hypothetical protein
MIGVILAHLGGRGPCGQAHTHRQNEDESLQILIRTARTDSPARGARPNRPCFSPKLVAFNIRCFRRMSICNPAPGWERSQGGLPPAVAIGPAREPASPSSQRSLSYKIPSRINAFRHSPLRAGRPRPGHRPPRLLLAQRDRGRFVERCEPCRAAASRV